MYVLTSFIHSCGIEELISPSVTHVLNISQGEIYMLTSFHFYIAFRLFLVLPYPGFLLLFDHYE
jgi:branched-subunit amino acid ABC-type transport system permease component